MDLPCHQLEGFREGQEFGEDNAKGEKEWKSKPSISPLGMSKHLQCSLAWIFIWDPREENHITGGLEEESLSVQAPPRPL